MYLNNKNIKSVDKSIKISKNIKSSNFDFPLILSLYDFFTLIRKLIFLTISLTDCFSLATYFYL